MSLTIGRATLNRPTSLSHSGDSVSLGFSIDRTWLTGGAAQAKALRQQLSGLANNPDEPVVPVTWSDDPDLDGFYKVTGVSVEPYITYLTHGTMRAQVQLERVGGGWSAARAEAPFVVAIRANSVGVAGGYTGDEPIHLVYPADLFGVAGNPGDLGQFINGFPSATGQVTGYGGDPSTGVLEFGVLPGSWYRGACLLEVYDGSTWWPVVGRQVPIAASAVWRISNGLIRAQFTGGSLVVEYAAGSGTWETLRSVSTNVASATKSAILRNGPDGVVVECAGATTLRSWRLAVRRGATFVEWAISTTVGNGGTDDALSLTSSAAVTAITDSAVDGTGTAQIGFYSGADANGNRLVVCSPSNGDGTTLTVTTGTGVLTWSGGTVAGRNAPRWLIGAYGDASPITYMDSFASVAKAMFTAVAHSTRVVSR